MNTLLNRLLCVFLLALFVTTAGAETRMKVVNEFKYNENGVTRTLVVLRDAQSSTEYLQVITERTRDEMATAMVKTSSEVINGRTSPLENGKSYFTQVSINFWNDGNVYREYTIIRDRRTGQDYLLVIAGSSVAIQKLDVG